ncbi:hypothetical protein JTB14_011428 [Gonioctena quinquepunctata]|nr:hypothetical protein JTB14_011428 [Gonioctena quinquepunctata]
MEGTEVSIKDVYLLLKGVNENLSRRIEVLEATTRNLTTVLQEEVETIRNKVEIFEKENISLKNQLLGKKAGHNRPILISLSSQIRRQEILRNARKLKGTKIVITEDLTNGELEERKILLGALKEAKSNNKTAFLKRYKLIVEGESYTVADIENAKKLDREESHFSPVTERKVVSEPPTPSPREYETEENLPEIESETEAAKKIEENKIEVESEKRVLRKEFIIAETKNTKEELKRSFKKEVPGHNRDPEKECCPGKKLENYKKTLIREAHTDLSDEEKVNYMILSMPQSYDGIITTALETMENLKLDIVKNRLLEQEEKKKRDSNGLDTNHCFLMFRLW